MDGVKITELQPPPVSLPRVHTWDLLSAEEGSPKGRAPTNLLSNPLAVAAMIEDQLQSAGKKSWVGSKSSGKTSWQQGLDGALADMIGQQRARWSAGAIARADMEDGCAV